MLLVQPLDAFFLPFLEKKLQVRYNAVTKSDIGMKSQVIIVAYQENTHTPMQNGASSKIQKNLFYISRE